LPIGALLAVTAPREVPDAEIDAFVGGFAVAAPVTSEDSVAAVGPRDIDAGGRRLRYFETGAGEGAPVVFVHGFGGDLNNWMFVQPTLAESRRTVALDLPGHGGSVKEVGDGSPDTLSGAVEAALQTLDIARAHLVGHSMGGAIAALVALRRPERVASLSLIAPAGLGPEVDSSFIDAFIGAGRRREAAEALSRLVHDPALVSRTMVEDVLRYKRLDGVQAALEAIARAWFVGGRQQLDLTTQILQLSVPVQVIWGRDDHILPAVQAGALASRLPVHILEATGHLPQLEQPAEVGRLLRGFIEERE
jgi:pyruvate dehydrogenase E2 component (dihydrolipoamide acetyltransferase)